MQLVKLSASRDMVIYHEEVELFFAFLCVECGEEHTVTLNAHHRSRREVCDGDEGLADELFRLIISVNTGENCAVCACAVVQSELEELLGLLHSDAVLDLHCTEIGLTESLEIDVFCEQRL